jgi:hypothetical protein
LDPMEDDKIIETQATNKPFNGKVEHSQISSY